MTSWGLPVSAVIGDREYAVNADFRDVLEVIEILQDREKHEAIRTLVSLSLFYDDFDQMPSAYHQEAVEWMMSFISCGEEDDAAPQPKLIDWVQDRMIIAAEVNKVAGIEVRSLEFLHWWTFIGYFNCIGEGQLSYIVSIREKLRKRQNLEKHEREFYNKNRSRVDFKQKFTREEEAVLSKWLV